jgi:hypothetical protein
MSSKEPVTPPATTAKNNTGTAVRRPKKTARGKTQSQDSEADASGYASTPSADEPGDDDDIEDTPIPRDKGKQPLRNPPEIPDKPDMQIMMQFMMDTQLQLMQLQLTLLQNQKDTRQYRPTQHQPFDMPPSNGSKQIAVPPPTMRPEEPVSAVRRTQQPDLASLPPPVEDLKKFDINLNEHPYDRSAQEETSSPPSDNDSSSDEYNYMSVDSGSDTDIGYETDITESDADMDANMDTAEDNDGDEDHDISDFAKLFVVNEHSLNYPNKFASDPVVRPPQVIDNGATTEMTITHDIEGNSASIPNTSLLSTKFPTTTDDKVDDTDNQLGTEKGYKLATVVEEKITLETIGILNSHKEALASRHSEKWKVAMAKEIDYWHLLVFPSGLPLIPRRWTVTSLN